MLSVIIPLVGSSALETQRRNGPFEAELGEPLLPLLSPTAAKDVLSTCLTKRASDCLPNQSRNRERSASVPRRPAAPDDRGTVKFVDPWCRGVYWDTPRKFQRLGRCLGTQTAQYHSLTCRCTRRRCDDEVLGSDSKLGPCGFHAQKPSEAFGWRPGPQERHAGRLLAVNVRVWCACAGGDVRTSRVGR